MVIELSNQKPVRLDVALLPAIEDMGFTGGRDGLRAFCGRAFDVGAPRFLRSASGDLVIYRHADLRAFGILPEVANVPPGVLFPGILEAVARGEVPLGAGIAEVISNQVFTANPPIHGPIRKILVARLGPKQAAAMEGVARAVVTDLLSALADGEEVDAVAAIAEPLTAHFWGKLLDMTDREIEDGIEAVRGMTAMFQIVPTLADVECADRSTATYGAIVSRAAMRSLGAGGNDFIASLAAGLAGIEPMSDPLEAGIVPRDVGALLAGNLVDGFHTAAVAAANTLYVLARRPAVLRQLREAPHLLGAAVMESLRCEPPVVALRRYVVRDVDYDGYMIPKGTMVTMLWAAGNHDPDAFPEPEAFRLDRAHGGITTFGAGTHLCPGRNVALMLVRVLIDELMAAGIELTPGDRGDDWIGNHLMNQLRTLPLRVRRGAPTFPVASSPSAH